MQLHRISKLAALVALLATQGAFAAEAAPGCAASTGVQALVCGDPELAGDERILDAFFADARHNAGAALATLDADQHAWLASRERCLSDLEPWACVRDTTLRRTAELRVRFRLIAPAGRAKFACDPAGRDLVEIEFFSTGPFMPTALARRAGEEVLLFQSASADGSRYDGPGTEVWLAGPGALVTWGKGAPQQECRAL